MDREQDVCGANKYKRIITHRGEKKGGTQREKGAHCIPCFPLWKQDPPSSFIFHRQHRDGWGLLVAAGD